MFRAFVLTILIGSGLAGSIVQRSDNSQQVQPQQQSQQSITDQNQISNPTYPSSQGSLLQYQYPSYPEYLDSGYATPTESKGDRVSLTSIEQPTLLSKFPMLVMPLIAVGSRIMRYGPQIATYLMNILLALAAGSVLATLVCTFTSLCSISFMGLSLNQYGVKEQVADLARTYITPESVNAATVMVTRAIDKYNAMQRERREKPKQAKR